MIAERIGNAQACHTGITALIRQQVVHAVEWNRLGCPQLDELHLRCPDRDRSIDQNAVIRAWRGNLERQRGGLRMVGHAPV